MRPRRQAKFPNKRHCEWYHTGPGRNEWSLCQRPTKFVLRLDTGDRFGYCAECVKLAENRLAEEKTEFKRSVVRRRAAKEIR